MPRKKRTPGNAELPRISGEIWEVGYRLLADAAAPSTQSAPTFLFVAQADGPGGIVFSSPTAVGDVTISLADAIEHAMREPVLGSPRQPEVIRVSSQADADALHDTLTAAGIRVEVTPQLAMLDELMVQMSQMLGGMTSDYRTRARQVGESLTDEGLRQVFQAAQQFHRRTPWEIYDDSELFRITIQPEAGTDKTLYGVILGQMDTEFGLALYASLDDLALVYDLDIDAEDELPTAHTNGDRANSEPRTTADMAAQFFSIPCVSLTFTAQQDTPPFIVEEAKALDLPLVDSSIYPFILSTGQDQMQVATASELGDILTAIRAILAWDDLIESIEYADEEEEEEEETDDDETLIMELELPAIEGFLPSLTIEVDLIDNPYTSDDDFDDRFADPDLSDIDIGDILGAFKNTFSEPAAKSRSAQTSPPTQARPPVEPEHAQVFTLQVYLIGGPLDDSYDDTEISRQIHILGHQTLHDLHLAIFAAFDREEEHLYEFNLGASPQDRSQLYFYQGDWGDEDDGDFGDPRTASLSDLDLAPEQRFGYSFDMGDQWEHVIEVISIKTGADKGPYPKLGEKIGSSPPQYPDFEEDEEEND